MKIELDIRKSYSDLSRENHLSCQVYINGEWLKEVVIGNHEINTMINCVCDSLVNRENLKYVEHDRCDHDPNCCCQFNPNYSTSNRGSSECCPVHNNHPSECLDDSDGCKCQERANQENI